MVKVQELLIFLLVIAVLSVAALASNFNQDMTQFWGRPQIQNGGQVMSLTLDHSLGSGCESANQFLGGRFDVQLKLVPDNSAGTVTTFFLSSQGEAHDEIDFEFLGNSSGQPYTVHTNVYVAGIGNREQQFRLWFDPTVAFHNYTIVWNPQRIIWMVDYIPVRVYTNYGEVPFPTTQPMKLYTSLWNADDWATQGGRVKTDWSKSPFIAYYMNYNADGCIVNGSQNSCNGGTSQPWQTKGLGDDERKGISWVQQDYMISDYCAQPERFPQGLPKECSLPRF